MTSMKPSRRSGGRAARKALRAAPPVANDQRPPIRAGGLEGGQYQPPLTQAGMERIHQAALDALEQIGLADAPPSGVEVLTKAGCDYRDGRLYFPRAMVEDMLAKAAKNITLCSRDGQHDLDLTGSRVHYGTAGGAAVHLVDAHGREYRDSTVQDLHDAARIVNQLDNIHFLQRPMVCRDIPDNREMDLNSIYASVTGTTKHVGVSFTEPDFVDDGIALLHMIAGGEDKWRERPFVSNSNCFVVPPMKFATESCEVMEKVIAAGMPVLLLSAGMATATAPPPTLAGAIVQAVAECLAGGVCYVNAIKPGHPAVFGTWPFVVDLRTGAMSGGSGEQALLAAGCSQMHKFYGLPGGAASGFSDSKLPDMQAGWEQMCSNVMAGLAGLNMVYEAAGMHASLLGFCHESLILGGDDIIGQALRCVRGIEVTEDSVDIDLMKSVCLEGPGHYLGGADKTLALMETEFAYPALGSRTSPKEWAEMGKPDLLDLATARKEAILADPPSAARLDPMLDAEIRQRFNIHLPA